MTETKARYDNECTAESFWNRTRTCTEESDLSSSWWSNYCNNNKIVAFVGVDSIACIMVLLFVVIFLYKRCAIINSNRTTNGGEKNNTINAATCDATCERIQAEQWERKSDFVKRAGNNYGYAFSPAGYIDSWRPEQFPCLIDPILSNNDRHRHHQNVQQQKEVYLDYAGSSLPSRSLLSTIYQDECSQQSILGNPHSSGPAASRTMRCIEKVKKQVMDHFGGHPGRFASVHTSSGSRCSSRSGGGCTAAASYNDNDKHNADPLFHSGYEVIFTSGATESLRIVAEHFPWSSNASNKNNNNSKSMLLYPSNAHTSVVGMRGPALAKGGVFCCQDLDNIMQCVGLQDDELRDTLEQWNTEMATSGVQKSEHKNNETVLIQNLLVLPAECNFGGDRPNVCGLIQRFRRLNSNNNTDGRPQWAIMLDLAKLACTSPINLKDLDPDFACVSFYKMFGAPTGLGALFVKRSATNLLLPEQRTIKDNTTNTVCTTKPVHRYFGGGSVDVVLSGQDFVVGRNLGQTSSSVVADMIRPSSLASLVHGTVHFRGISALSRGFDELKRLGGIQQIEQHTHALAKEFVSRLQSLRHGNQRPVVSFHGAWGKEQAGTEGSNPGPVIAFNVYRANGAVVGYNEVSKLAALNNPPLQLRTGCFCNPGACQKALKQGDEEIVDHFLTSGHVCGDTVDIVNGKPTGLCRVSFGKDSTWEDLDAFVVFLEKHFVSSARDTQAESRNSILQTGPTKAILTEVYIYPIKSCAGQRVSQLKMELPSGRLQYDREFALVDSFGTALRLQKFPKMCLIQPRVDLTKRTLAVSAPNMVDLVLRLDQDGDDTDSKTMVMNSIVSVCGNKCIGT